MASWISISPVTLVFSRQLPFPATATASPSSARRTRFFRSVHCAPPQQLQQQDDDEAGILCEPCDGKGWLLCDFCKGQKTNVKSENNRIYRRCPSCRAVGYVLCAKCKVFKCVTFPSSSDGESLSF